MGFVLVVALVWGPSGLVFGQGQAWVPKAAGLCCWRPELKASLSFCRENSELMGGR